MDPRKRRSPQLAPLRPSSERLRKITRFKSPMNAYRRKSGPVCVGADEAKRHESADHTGEERTRRCAMFATNALDGEEPRASVRAERSAEDRLLDLRNAPTSELVADGPGDAPRRSTQKLEAEREQ